MKIFKIIFLALAIITTLIALYAFLVFSRPFQFIPDLEKNLSRTIETGNKEYSDRVKAQFPLGTEEQDLLIFIDKQKFKISLDKDKIDDFNKAIFSYNRFPCRTDLSIVWRTNDDKINFIDGKRSVTCL